MARPLTIRLRLSGPAFLAAFAIAACGSDAIAPEDDPLRDIDELAIHAALVDHLAVLRHSAGASANVRLALGAQAPPTAPPPAELHGHTMRLDTLADGWVAEADPAVASSTVRILWYDTSNAAITIPPVLRGHVDLTDLGDPTFERVRLRAVRTGAAEPAADYEMRFGSVLTGATRTFRFDANGQVRDSARALQLDRAEQVVEQVATGDAATTFHIDVTGTGFRYRTGLEEAWTAASETSRVALVTTVTLNGVATIVELELEEGSGLPPAGTGVVRHGGRVVAHLTTADARLTFVRPDGGAFSDNQQRRLGTLVTVLLSPLPALQAYFP
jgi:hypothetical protein